MSASAHIRIFHLLAVTDTLMVPTVSFSQAVTNTPLVTSSAIFHVSGLDWYLTRFLLLKTYAMMFALCVFLEFT